MRFEKERTNSMVLCMFLVRRRTSFLFWEQWVFIGDADEG